MNVFHPIPGAIPEHTPDVSAACPDCQRIQKLWRAFREFGYSDLTLNEQREAYHVAMTRDVTAADGIIAMLTRSQLRDAGLVKDETGDPT